MCFYNSWKRGKRGATSFPWWWMLWGQAGARKGRVMMTTTTWIKIVGFLATEKNLYGCQQTGEVNILLVGARKKQSTGPFLQQWRPRPRLYIHTNIHMYLLSGSALVTGLETFSRSFRCYRMGIAKEAVALSGDRNETTNGQRGLGGQP